MRLTQRWAAVLLAIIVAAASANFKSQQGTVEAARPQATVSGPLPDLSIYHLEGGWQDQLGQGVTLKSLRGQPQVVAMIYGGCEGACPRIIADIKSVEEAVKKAHPEGVGYLLVTMDPDVDSTARLRDLAAEFKLGSSWRLLRGSPDQVRELAATLGVKYRKVSDTQFAHSNTVTVLDSEGVVVFQKQELGVGVERSVKAVEDLLVGQKDCCPAE